MYTLPRTAKQLAAALLLGGLSICTAAVASAQAPPATGGPVPAPLPGMEIQEPAPKADAAPAKPTGWAAIPSYSLVEPRPGDFWLPPSGPGFYTALDCLRGEEKEKPAPNPYRNCFFNNDFRYLDGKDAQPVDCLDSIKRMHLGGLFDPCGDNWVLSIGGEERIQFKNEIASRLTARDNNYDLLRTRVYADLWYKDTLRFYVEYLDARSFNEDLPPLPIDVDKSDLLDAFVDVKVADVDGNPVYVRVGRQEMLLGSQRLVSTLDWANTRRTFDGVRGFYRSEKFDLDAFYTRPVVVSPSHFDSSDMNRQFAGLFAAYRPEKGQELNAYYFYLDYDLKVPFGYTPGGRAGYNINTFGGRYTGDRKIMADGCGDHGNMLWDFEGALQLGDYSNRNDFAGFSSTGVGYQATQLPLQPAFWVYYDYASGAANPNGTGTFSTFNQLFPFGHYYLGFLDLVGRENSRDLNFQATCFPTKWMTALAQYHIFDLDEPRSQLFGKGPQYPVERSSPTGVAGIQVGEELDLLVNMQLSRHSNLMLGFSKLFEGDFVRKSGPSVSPELYYIQYSFRW